ncbi:MAG: undecaprenyl-diphosphate phosphatase [Clostridia bacterium]|nr:undecaprenyl-diphosphate phosphatase [Clostridia bacterium]
MNIFLAILYGIIQGIAEFLPISSSAHLAIAQNMFGMENLEASYFTFDILLHFGTLVAVFIVYYKDIFALVPAVFTMLGKVFKGKFKLSEYTETEKFVIFVIIATLPLFVGVLFKDYVEAIGNYTKIIGGILLFNGLVLFISDKLEKGTITLDNTKPLHALFIGLCQMCALVPGLSRSGSTITGGLFMGFKRELAVKFSFIMSIPAILGANILSLTDIAENPIAKTDIVPYVAGTVAAAVVGVLAMKLLIYISKKSNFRMFSYYCWGVGILAIIFG